jgi:hypothetical protein
VTFVACTDDNSSVAYLNAWDRKMRHVDVVDDYHSERTEIQAKRGIQFVFTFGNYVVKTLVGSVDPEFDSLDESQTQLLAAPAKPSEEDGDCCCTVQ